MMKLEAALEDIAMLDRADLGSRWVQLTGRPVPRLSVKMLRFALGCEIQAKAMGGLSRSTRRQLDEPVVRRAGVTPLAPGMRLVREWQGNLHVVTVGEDGAIVWNGRPWKSLSAIARTITGTRWSGPVFFGLKGRKAA